MPSSHHVAGTTPDAPRRPGFSEGPYFRAFPMPPSLTEYERGEEDPLYQQAMRQHAVEVQRALEDIRSLGAGGPAASTSDNKLACQVQAWFGARRHAVVLPAVARPIHCQPSPARSTASRRPPDPLPAVARPIHCQPSPARSTASRHQPDPLPAVTRPIHCQPSPARSTASARQCW